MAAATGSPRTAAQTETARFYTETLGAWTARNLRRFATANESLADNARLLAMLWVATSDAIGARFEAKYHHDFWRPTSAISFTGGSGPHRHALVVPTPNHPSIRPHTAAATAQSPPRSMPSRNGRGEVAFDSTVTGTTHTHARTDDLTHEVTDARVWGGCFRNSGGRRRTRAPRCRLGGQAALSASGLTREAVRFSTTRRDSHVIEDTAAVIALASVLGPSVVLARRERVGAARGGRADPGPGRVIAPEAT
jgi:hypothetical protein